eukprot:832015-Pelagomonas_calceolata.AAC.2
MGTLELLGFTYSPLYNWCAPQAWGSKYGGRGFEWAWRAAGAHGITPLLRIQVRLANAQVISPALFVATSFLVTFGSDRKCKKCRSDRTHSFSSPVRHHLLFAMLAASLSYRKSNP